VGRIGGLGFLAQPARVEGVAMAKRGFGQTECENSFCEWPQVEAGGAGPKGLGTAKRDGLELQREPKKLKCLRLNAVQFLPNKSQNTVSLPSIFVIYS
jgi:hypothetical protein